MYGKKAAAIHPAAATNVTDALPEKLRSRAGKTLADLAGGSAAGKDLRALLDEARQSLRNEAAAGRKRLNEDWRAVQKTLEAMPGMRPTTRKRKT